MSCKFWKLFGAKEKESKESNKDPLRSGWKSKGKKHDKREDKETNMILIENEYI